MTQLHFDFETFSEVNLKTKGLDVYCRDPSTKALLLSWKLDNGPVLLWDIARGEPMPESLMWALCEDSVQLHAFNARFERLILKYVLSRQLRVDFDIPVRRFRCTQFKAYGLSFKGSLEEVLTQVGFPDHSRKIKEGKSLIDRFSKPQSLNRRVHIYTHLNDPENWQQFRQYCARDTEVEYELDLWLEQFHPISDREWELYELDQKINDRGAPVDLELCKKAQTMHRALRAKIKDELIKMTSLGNPLSNQQMRTWLMLRGVDLPNLKEDTVLKVLPSLEGDVKEVLGKYYQATRSAGTKWKAFADRANEDGRVRGTFQIGGASRTRRWAGRGVQLHNLRHGPVDDVAAEVIATGSVELLQAMYEQPMDILASTIRAAVTAPQGRSLVVSDLTSIESVVVGHLSGCEALENIYRRGQDAYRVFGSNYFGVPYDQITKAQRSWSKPPVLGCGFGLGWKGLIKYAEGYGVVMLEHEARRAVDLFRASYPEVPEMWYGLLEGIEGIINSPIGIAWERFMVRIFRDEYFLYIELPSGRRLAYYRPAWVEVETPVGRRPSFTYMGVHRFTQKWTRIAAHGGLVTENIAQATARDILVEGMMKFDATVSGWDDEIFLIAHVHDEPIAESDEEKAYLVLAHLKKCMTEQPYWLPGIWLGAGGWVGRRYRKD